MPPKLNGPETRERVFFKLILRIDSKSCETVRRRQPQNPIGDKSMFVQIMESCRQAANQYLRQCMSSSMSPCGVTMPQESRKTRAYVKAADGLATPGAGTSTFTILSYM